MYQTNGSIPLTHISTTYFYTQLSVVNGNFHGTVLHKMSRFSSILLSLINSNKESLKLILLQRFSLPFNEGTEELLPVIISTVRYLYVTPLDASVVDLGESIRVALLIFVCECVSSHGDLESVRHVVVNPVIVTPSSSPGTLKAVSYRPCRTYVLELIRVCVSVNEEGVKLINSSLLSLFSSIIVLHCIKTGTLKGLDFIREVENISSLDVIIGMLERSLKSVSLVQEFSPHSHSF
jgi:hypothetical protein